MKNTHRKLLSLIAAVTVLLNAAAGIAAITVSADDVYITRTVSYDCTADGVSGSDKGNKYLRYDYNNTWVIDSGTYGFIPLSYVADTACYEIWNRENVSSFSLYTMNSKTITDSEIAEWYKLYGSADGEVWYALPYVRDSKYQAVLGSGGSFASYKLTASDIPDGTGYIKLVSAYNNSAAWNHGFLKAEIQYKELLNPPEITAEYKNYYGVYANRLSSGGRATRDVKLCVSNMDADKDAELTVLKDGARQDAGKFYSAAENAYIFNGNGKYEVTAKNSAGKSTISFEVKKTAEDGVVTKTTVDDIYNTGRTIAAELSDTVDATSKVIMSIAKSPGAHVIPSDKYYMFPYNHGKDEPAAYAVWYSDIGFGSFSVETLNYAGSTEGIIKSRYSFYYSADGNEWTEAEFSVGEAEKSLTGSGFESRKLTVGKIPDGVRYIKYLSLITDSTKNSGWVSGIIRASYTTYVSMPVIKASYKGMTGDYLNPVGNGSTVPSSVKIEYLDADSEVGGSTAVKKDGKEISLSADGILTENGSYEISASNVKGTAKLNFNIDNSLAYAKSETYRFSEGAESAREEYDRLLSVTPPGAPADFTRGDGHVTADDTAILKNYDKSWWGLTDGGTKLTVGSDSKGYQKDGYFYFVNVGSDGEKYTGISITYTAAVQSSYPTDAYISVYSADKYNGSYRLIKPVSVTAEPYTGSPAVAVYHATYYLGGEGSVVRVELHPEAPAASLWMGSFLSVLDITKLSLPLIKVESGGKSLVDNSVTQSNAVLNVSDMLYFFVEKDGKAIEIPDDNRLTEDGYYTVTACNYSGTSALSFYIAKEIPVIQLVDSSGNYLNDAQTVTDDVRVIFYNADISKTVKDGALYSTDSELTVDLNGRYEFYAENDFGEYEISLILKRPLSAVKAYNFRKAEIKDKDTVTTQVTYSIAAADSYKITLNGKEYKPQNEFELTEEGNYIITAVNKAGETALEFTIRYNPPLSNVPHAGDTVVSLNYEKISGTKWNDGSVYKSDNVVFDKSSALQSDWTGFKGGVLHAASKETEELFVTYKAAGFRSFHLYAAVFPKSGMSVEDMYSLYVSVNGNDFKTLEYTSEQDISYITTGYEKYRLIARDIPQGAKYIKVVVKQEGAAAAWSRCITNVEYSYDKANAGILDADDTIFMLSDAFEGETVEISLYNGNNDVIPKRVFEAFRETDKSLKVNLMNSAGETEFTLLFNGLNITEPQDFSVGVSLGQSQGSKLLKARDSGASAIIFKQQRKWTVGLTLGIFLGGNNIGKSYTLYAYKNGEFSNAGSAKVGANGFVSFELFENADYILSSANDLVKDDETVYEPEEIDNDNSGGTYVMVVNRKKFVPDASGANYIMWVIIAIAAVLLAGAAAVTVILLKVKRKALKG